MLVDSKEEISKKIQAEKKNILDTAKDTETLKLVTIRPKRKADDKITAPGKVKRAKAVGDILEHFSEHSSQVKAELVSKIIDREGANFGQNVFQKYLLIKTSKEN